jgi:type IV pilus assembly protein PilB
MSTDAALATPAPTRPPADLGALLVDEGIISARQLATALALVNTGRKLGRVLVEERITSEQRIHETIKKHAAQFRVGELLILLDLLTPAQLDECLAAQRTRPGMRIGEVAIELGLVSERPLLRALSYQFGFPYIEPDLKLVDLELMRRLPAAYLRRLEIVPMHFNGKSVTVVTPDPTRADVVRELRATLRMPVERAIGPRSAILKTITEFEQQHRAARPARPGEAVSKPEENVVAIVDHLLKQGVEDRASDIHIEPMLNRVRVRFRIDGELVHKTDLPQALAPQIASRVKVLCKADLAERRRHQDGRIVYTEGGVDVDMRVSIYVTVHGENIVIRILNKTAGILPMEKLGMLPPLLQKYKEAVLDVVTGVVLFTGPTGSGKTTSLYSSISYCNETGVKIITVEDPVEFMLDGLIQCSIDEGAGRDFPNTLREVVRQDPDIIVVGEIRDRSTAAIAIEAALTGHKVFATFHTEDSIGSLIRLVDMNIEAFLICSTVVSAVAQRLARRICTHCKTTTTPSAYEVRLLGLDPEEVAEHTFYRGHGCDACDGTGYRGRVGIYEMLILDGPIREMVLARRPAQEIRHHALHQLGLFTLQEDGIAKALLGDTTLEEVLNQVPRSGEQRTLREIAVMARQEI